MMKKCILISFVFVFMLSLLALPPVCSGEVGNDKSIKIISDRLDAYDDKNMIIFSGNVVVTKEDIVINSDKISLYYIDHDGDNEKTSTGMMRSGEIDRIEAEGNVKIEKEGRFITGKSAIFHNGDQKIIVQGNAVMKDGENVISGDIITFFLKENRGVVESSGNGRVTATISSDE